MNSDERQNHDSNQEHMQGTGERSSLRRNFGSFEPWRGANPPPNPVQGQVTMQEPLRDEGARQSFIQSQSTVQETWQGANQAPGPGQAQSSHGFAPGFQGHGAGHRFSHPPRRANPPGGGMAMAGMIMGILSLVTWLFAGFLIFGPLAIIFGIVGKKQALSQGRTSGAATAGIVMGIVSLAGGLLLCVSCIVFLGGLGGFENFLDELLWDLGL